MAGGQAQIGCTALSARGVFSRALTRIPDDDGPFQEGKS